MSSSHKASGDEPELPPDLNRADAMSALELPAISKEEALDLLAKSMAAFESLKGTIERMQASGEAASAQLAVAAAAEAAQQQGSPADRGSIQSPMGSSAIDRARQANAGVIKLLRTQLEESQAAASAVRKELESERALRIAAELKLDEVRLQQRRNSLPQQDAPPQLVYAGSSSFDSNRSSTSSV